MTDGASKEEEKEAFELNMGAFLEGRGKNQERLDDKEKEKSSFCPPLRPQHHYLFGSSKELKNNSF